VRQHKVSRRDYREKDKKLNGIKEQESVPSYDWSIGRASHPAVRSADSLASNPATAD
jgi:hypothetical protein